ncbi:hypothetical protein BHM03_00031359 [Ensete ventricosum]|nr:hypothetical protein BHM03_00031359 [Ensete ventricosum]
MTRESNRYNLLTRPSRLSKNRVDSMVPFKTQKSKRLQNEEAEAAPAGESKGRGRDEQALAFSPLPASLAQPPPLGRCRKPLPPAAAFAGQIASCRWYCSFLFPVSFPLSFLLLSFPLFSLLLPSSTIQSYDPW